jgi:hypothetical protein
VTAPGGEEFNKNERELIDGILKGLVGKDHDVVFGGVLALSLGCGFLCAHTTSNGHYD